MVVGIYGIGNYAEELLYEIECANRILNGMFRSSYLKDELEIKIKYFVETTRSLDIFRNIRVINAEEIRENDIDFLIIAAGAYLEIIDYLKEHNPNYEKIKKKIVRSTQIQVDTRKIGQILFKLPSKSEFLVEKETEGLFEVKNNRLNIESDDKRYYVLCPYGFGDTLYLLGYIGEYVKKWNIKEGVCVIIKRTHKFIADMYPYIESKIADDNLVDKLNKYMIVHQLWRLDNFLYGHFEKNEDGTLSKDTAIFAWTTMLEQYCRLVCDIPISSKFLPPKIDFDTKKRKYDNLNWERTIFLLPLATTCEKFDKDFWKIVIEKIKKEGFGVVVNMPSRMQWIMGVMQIYESVEDTLFYCSKSRAVISYRSGMTDLIAFLNTDLHVINPTEYWYKEWDVKIACERENIWNYLVKRDQYLSVVDEIVRKI